MINTRDRGPGISSVRLMDIVVFLIPASAFVDFNIIGNLFLPEILLLFLLPFLIISKGRLLIRRNAVVFLFLGTLWLLSQIGTDLIRSTPFTDYSRGWARIAFLLINFVSIYLLLADRSRRLIIFALGLVVGDFITYFVNPSVYAASLPWKFGIGVPITWTLVLLAVAFYGRKKVHSFLSIGLLLLAAFLNLFLGFRSLSLICFLTTVFLVLKLLQGKPDSLGASKRLRNMVFLGSAFGIAVLAFIQVYGYAVREGALGETAQQIYDWQAYGAYGLLIGGRAEILVSSQAILESPVIGYGSWAKNWHYAYELVRMRTILGYGQGRVDSAGLIPSHSHLFGAWVEAGILGAIFWIWGIILAIKVFVKLRQDRHLLEPLIIFVSILIVWDIFFSPFGGNRRFVTPYYYAVLISANNSLNSRMNKSTLS